jgi:hypothetical protein
MWENPMNVEQYIKSRQCGMLKDSRFINVRKWMKRIG